MATSMKFRGNIRKKANLINKPRNKSNLLSLEMNKERPDNVKAYAKNRMYKKRIIAVEFFNYFKSKGEVFITQNEILSEFIKQGWSKSYIYLKLKKFSEGIVKRNFGSDKVDIFEPLLLEVSRLEIDNKVGMCYKLNNCWKEVAVNDIAKTFYGK